MRAHAHSANHQRECFVPLASRAPTIGAVGCQNPVLPWRRGYGHSVCGERQRAIASAISRSRGASTLTLNGLSMRSSAHITPLLVVCDCVRVCNAAIKAEESVGEGGDGEALWLGRRGGSFPQRPHPMHVRPQPVSCVRRRWCTRSPSSPLHPFSPHLNVLFVYRRAGTDPCVSQKQRWRRIQQRPLRCTSTTYLCSLCLCLFVSLSLFHLID